MVTREFRLSSSWLHFVEEWERLKLVFLNLRYPVAPVDSTISQFISQHQQPHSPDCPALQRPKSADVVRGQLTGLVKNIGKELQPVFTMQ